GHGTSIGGVIIDGGKFDWKASGKFPGLTEPDAGYHGVRFTEAAGGAAYITRARVVLLRDTGAALSPFNSFLFLQGLETLSLRVERHVKNAVKLAKFLENHPKVDRVKHPSLATSPYNDMYKIYFPGGGGSIFTFEIKGGAEEAKAFIDRLKIFSLLANVADVKSLVIHPASTTHSQMNGKELLDSGIRPNTIRLSVGIEHIDDLIDDLSQAFTAV
ncbi:MAG: PLP-dependent transferase, partial [Bacillota bacterium]|nr:PLP-dependent transferase [Bacillota bacterium]